MKIIILDSKEFDTSSEESICIAIDHCKWWKNIDEFYTETCKIHWSLKSRVKKLSAELFIRQVQSQSLSMLTYYLQEVNMLLIGNEKCIVVAEEWDIKDYLVFYKHYFIRFCWTTTA